MSVPWDWVYFRGMNQKFVHLSEATDFGAGSVYCEDEDKNDSEENGRVRAIGY